MKGLWPLRPSQPPMATSDTRPACASGAALPRSSISAPPRSSSPLRASTARLLGGMDQPPGAVNLASRLVAGREEVRCSR